MPYTEAPDSAGQLERAHEVGRDVALGVAAADREDEHGVAGAEPRDLEPAENVVSQPSSLVRAVSSLTLSVGA